MNTKNALAAPCLLIAAMVILILFRSVIFASGGVLYEGPGQEDPSQMEQLETGEAEANYVSLNAVRYKPDQFFILSVISNVFAFLFPAAFYIKLKGAGHSKNLKLSLPKAKYVPFAICMFLALVAGTVLISSVSLGIMGGEADIEGTLPNLFYTGGKPAYELGVMVSFVLLPAFCEEFFFRSVLSAEYEQQGAIAAAAIGSAAFALAHFSLKFFLVYLFAAVIFYITAKITNSAPLAMILHAGYNFFCIYLWDKFLGSLRFEQNRTIFVFINAIVFIICIALVLGSLETIYYKKAYNNDPSPLPREKSERRFDAAARFFSPLLSPTFIIAIIIFFVYVNIQ